MFTLTKGKQHGCKLFIPGILLAKVFHQVALLQLDGCEDVSRCQQRKKQVGSRHYRGRPEGDKKSEIKRVPYKTVKQGQAEGQAPVPVAAKLQPYLTQAKQVEVVDQEGADQHNGPSRKIADVQQGTYKSIVHFPDGTAQGLPLPHHQ